MIAPPMAIGEMSRGFYCLLSAPSGEARAPLAAQLGGAHVDTHPAHLTMTCCLENVAPGGGGTLSHGHVCHLDAHRYIFYGEARMKYNRGRLT
jgi:hypothetical protein